MDLGGRCLKQWGIRDDYKQQVILPKYTTTGCFSFHHFWRTLMNYREQVNKTHKPWMKFSSWWNAKTGPWPWLSHSRPSRFAAASLQELLLPPLLYSLGLPLGADPRLSPHYFPPHPPSQPSLLGHLHSFLSATYTQKHLHQGPSVATLGWDSGT